MASSVMISLEKIVSPSNGLLISWLLFWMFPWDNCAGILKHIFEYARWHYFAMIAAFQRNHIVSLNRRACCGISMSWPGRGVDPWNLDCLCRKKQAIESLKATTRDIPDYDVLMQQRLRILDENGYGLNEIQEVISTLDPFARCERVFLDWFAYTFFKWWFFRIHFYEFWYAFDGKN